MNSSEGTLWLAIHFQISFTVYLQATQTGFAPENVPLFAEKNEFESSLCFIPIQIFTSMSVSGGEGGDEGLTI